MVPYLLIFGEPLLNKNHRLDRSNNFMTSGPAVSYRRHQAMSQPEESGMTGQRHAVQVL